MKSVIRNIIILLVIIILGVVGYQLFFKKKADTNTGAALQTTAGLGATAASGTANSGATVGPSVGQDFLGLLLNVESIKLDDSIFTSKAFTILQDFNRPIPEDHDPGRQNPFAPIGSDTTSVATQVSTSNPSSITTTTTTLNGSITVGGSSVTRWFEYGTSSLFGSTTPQKTQDVAGAFAEPIDKLLPNTIYFARADASIAGTTIAGNVITWKTAISPVQKAR